MIKLVKKENLNAQSPNKTGQALTRPGHRSGWACSQVQLTGLEHWRVGPCLSPCGGPCRVEPKVSIFFPWPGLGARACGPSLCFILFFVLSSFRVKLKKRGARPGPEIKFLDCGKPTIHVADNVTGLKWARAKPDPNCHF